MAGAVWLHVGTPKSGTSSLQSYFSRRAQSPGFDYVTLSGKSCCNDLAIALNRGRDTLPGLAGALDAALRASEAPVALLSSEMFYGLAPEALLDRIPALAAHPLNVLVYLRRQDRYLEAMYLQKAKNGRFIGSFQDYIDRFHGSGSDYWAMLAPWRAMQDAGRARLVPRVLEPARLQGGDVVADACALMGLPAPETPEVPQVNVSPGLHRVQLLQAAAAAKIGDPRRLQRRLAAAHPQAPEERGAILSQPERRRLVASFAASNEALRARYFPQETALFAEDDLQGEADGGGIAPFTPEQLTEITRLLEVIAAQG